MATSGSPFDEEVADAVEPTGDVVSTPLERSQAVEADPGYRGNLRRAIFASSVGSALEYYDFALYGLATALIFNRIFFPELGPGAGVAAGFATYAVGFLARPLGGIVFGTLGDKLGRKTVLVITIALMGGATTLIGLLPSGATIGVWAPVLLVVLRILQGLGAGAEQAGSTVLMAEYAPIRRRGYYAALPFVGIMVGTILASVVFALLGLADQDVITDWLWRIPFLGSLLLIAVAVFIRLRLAESPAFQTLEKQEQIAENPLKEVFASSWRTIVRGIGLRMAENGGSAIYQTLAVSFIAGVFVGVPAWVGPLAIALGAGLGIVVIPLSGALSDRFGRMRVYRIGSVVQLVLAIPAWAIMSTGNVGLIIPTLAVTYGVGVNIMLGAQCAALPELFGNRHRYIGVAVSREFSAVIAGGIAPLVGTSLITLFTGSWIPGAVYAVVLTVITLLTTFVTPETRARDLDLVTDALGDTDEEVSTRPVPIDARHPVRSR